jgi:predicted transposase/invertase (TIGR01784 family)
VSILDVRATDQRKQQFIVEMQVAEQAGFAKRVLYYLSKAYVNQIKRADQYRKLKPTYFIGILGDFSHTNNPHYISRSRILDIDTGEPTITDVEFNFIELQKFDKKLNELRSLSDKWIYFIKNASDLTVIPTDVDDEGLLSAYEEANQHTWTQEEIDAYDYVDMREEDARAQLDAAEARGKRIAQMQAEAEKAELKAKAEAEKAQAEAEKAELKAKAEAEKAELKAKAEAEKVELILNFHKLGIPITAIALATQKTASEIQDIIDKAAMD